MTWINDFLDLLNHPFTEKEEFKVYVRKLALVGVFVSLFLYILRPFNIHGAGQQLWLFSLAFGVITFVVGLIYDLMLTYLFRIKQYGPAFTFWKWILVTIGFILVLGIANFSFLALVTDIPISLLPEMIVSTFIVGVFPMVFIGSITMIQNEKKHEKIASKINKNTSAPDINPEVKTVQLFDSIDSNDVLYIEALQNYVTVHYLEHGELNKQTQRATIKSIEAKINDTALVKCHRSFIVNKSKVQDIKGNAQGLKLFLNGVDEYVPVSRSNIGLFRS